MIYIKKLTIIFVIFLLLCPLNLATKPYVQTNVQDYKYEFTDHTSTLTKYNISKNVSPLKYTTLVNISIPQNNDIYRMGDMIYINGTIDITRFKRYVIEYGRGINPTDWETTGIELINNGKQSIVNNTIATWDTSHLLEPDFFSLRIQITFRKTIITNIISNLLSKLHIILNEFHHPYDMINNDETFLISNIYLDPTIREGWPQRIPWSHHESQTGNYYIWPGKVLPVVSDVDKDGMKEIFILQKAEPYSLVYGFEADGTSMDGWPIEIINMINPMKSQPTVITPTIVDTNGDGYQEIIISFYDGLQIFSYDGSLMNVIELSVSHQPRVETPIIDLDQDGELEIIKEHEISGGDGSYLSVLDLQGNIKGDWPQLYVNFSGPDGIYAFSATYEAVPAVGNFDDDADLEIVIVSGRNVFDDPENPSETHHIEGRITVFNMDGSILKGFPVDIDGWIYHSPVVGDINNDGHDEIIVGSTYFAVPGFNNTEYGLYVIDRYGNVCDGWPQLTGQGFGVCHNPSLADFNKDGFLEIIAGTVDQYDDVGHSVYVFDYQGNILPGWPIQTVWYSPVSPVIADITYDDIPDIILAAGSGMFPGFEGAGGIYAWEYDGSIIEGFPKITEMEADATVTITDLDDDGRLELIGSSDDDADCIAMNYKYRSSIYVWDLDVGYNEDLLPWPMFQHDLQYSGWYHFS